MTSFFTSTGAFIGPANAVINMLGCDAVDKLYDRIYYNMCTVAEPVSEQFTGALILQLYLLLVAMLIF